jgi:hypothetical protein
MARAVGASSGEHADRWCPASPAHLSTPGPRSSQRKRHQPLDAEALAKEASTPPRRHEHGRQAALGRMDDMRWKDQRIRLRQHANELTREEVFPHKPVGRHAETKSGARRFARLVPPRIAVRA